MFLRHIDLTTALRPSYLPDEVLLFVQDNVGLYEGKFKLPDQQNGQVYLTTHRICYVDKADPRENSVALDLKDVEGYEYYAGFLKSSPKITVIPKPLKRALGHARASSTASSIVKNASPSPSPATRETGFRPPPESAATWVCTICSYSNPVPANFDSATANAHTPLAPCLACGIKPTLAHVLKASISNASHRRPMAAVPPVETPSRLSSQLQAGDISPSLSASGPSTAVVSQFSSPRLEATPDTFTCPRCTFSNHPSLLSCEICGAPLLSRNNDVDNTVLSLDNTRSDSPAPLADSNKLPKSIGIDVSENVKLSFRSGGVKIFYERLKGSMTQRKWLLQDAPPAPGTKRSEELQGRSSDVSQPKSRTAGIAGLEQLDLNMHKNNEVLIGNAFEDLEALMASAKDVIALAERFARQNGGSGDAFSAEDSAILAESASQLGLVTTKDMLGGGSGSESLYLSELSRNLAEFLTDDSRGVLKRAGGIITLVDLWAMFNRARGGVELVSPMDFEKAARLWEELKLPVRLRTFRSGVMVVQGRERTDSTTIKALLSWLQDLHEFPPEKEVSWDWQVFGMGVTAQEAAERFGWSLGIAEEELLLAEEEGALCREEGLEGLKFWKNYIDTGDTPAPKTDAYRDQERILQNLVQSGLI